MEPTEIAIRFRALHLPGQPLLMPNPWDAGSARVLAHLGFAALATTSSGYAATLGRHDGAVTRSEALAHAAALVGAAPGVPVSADLENGFGRAARPRRRHRAGRRRRRARRVLDRGLDRPTRGIYGVGLATERIRAAAETAGGRGRAHRPRGEPDPRRPDLDDTIARLQAYAEAGADVVYAPGLVELPDIRRVVASVDRPVNVLVRPGMAPVPELAAAGVARVSVGGSFAFAALGTLGRVARELREDGTYGFLGLAAEGSALAGEAFPS